MDRKTYLDKIITEFENWWVNDQHSSNMDFYKNTITFSYLTSLSDNDFMNFFYTFVSEGGRVQSGGDRKKNQFRATVLNDIENFRQYVVKPFQEKFSLKDWFLQVDKYTGFGVGIATIFLNRVDYEKYPIMNNKTLKALKKLGYKISSSKNWTNYELVKKYQDNLITDFPILKNYYKADALNHFLVDVYLGQELILDYLQIETFENGLEQNEIEQKIEADSENLDKQDLYDKILDCQNDNSEKVLIKGKIYKRYNYLMVQIKKYRDYKCQFCPTRIKKANGNYYIEACHIKAKSEGGQDSLDNILILCPNCHKLFDYGYREREKHTKDKYSVFLNGKKYETGLK
ncbi:MAG: HNH endonuclease [Bacteroidales bacterium]|nr:HNH endonuclease [Bacteroidales bacterium]